MVILYEIKQEVTPKQKQCVKISCINNYFGCNASFLRKNLTKHLQKCPAYVILCNSRWSRFRIDKEEEFFRPKLSPYIDTNRLDVSFSFYNEKISKQLDELTKTKLTNDYKDLEYPELPYEVYHGKHESSEEEEEETKHDFGKETNNITKVSLNEINKKREQNLQISYPIFGLGFYMEKPDSPEQYKFICGQNFRNDQFKTHFINVHVYILGGIDGWIEHKCPLWYLGCNYVERRIHPSPRGSKIQFNMSIGTFNHNLHPKCPKFPIDIQNLPSEIILKIFSYLDSSTLNNVSLTCHKLRSICRYFLTQKGIVSPVWKRLSSTNRWVFAYKKWYFSNHFDEISTWYFDDSNVRTHLKACPFNIVKLYHQKIWHRVIDDEITGHYFDFRSNYDGNYHEITC